MKRTSITTHRMLVLTVVDQGASSISNFALAVLVAHYSGPRALGVFALATSTYIITQGLVRSFSSDCLLTRPETDDLVMARYELGGYVTALVLSTIVALVVLMLCLVMTKDFALTFLIFGLSFPFMALQDFARYIGISRREPGYAIRLDVAWFVLFLLAYSALHAQGWVTMPWLFGAWTVTGAAVGITTLLAHVEPGLRESVRFWSRSERAVGARFAGQFLISSVSTYLIFYLLVLFVISVSVVGVIRLSYLALGPVTVMSAGVLTALVPLATRRFQHARASALRFLAAAGAGMAALTMGWAVVLYVAPVATLRRTLGPTWPQSRPLLLWAGLALAFACLLASASAGLRALRAAKENFRVAVAVMPVAIGLPVGGASLSGAHGFVVSAALAGALYAVVAWVVLWRVSARVQMTESVAEEGTASPPDGLAEGGLGAGPEPAGSTSPFWPVPAATEAPELMA